jgi:hypothetical protein
MKQRIVTVTGLLLVALLGPAHAWAQDSTLTAPEIFRRASAAVVLLRVFDAKGQSIAQGSGFIAADGRIVSNAHVVAGGARVEVADAAGQLLLTVPFAEALSTTSDLVVLSRIADAPGTLPVARTPAAIGDRVYVIGAPEGLANTISDGLLSGMRDVEERKLLQISAPISSGSSGGPVLNARGEVIGVSVASLRLGQNLNFAVTLADLRALLNSPPDRVPFPSADVFEEPGPQTVREERPPRRDAPSRSSARGVLEHFAISVLVCGVPNRSDSVSCGIQITNTDSTGRKNKRLYVDAVYMTDNVGVKSEATEAQFGGKVGRIKGWAQLLDDQIPPGGTLLLIAAFTEPRLLGTSGTLLLKLSIGFGGSTKDVVIGNVPIQQR